MVYGIVAFLSSIVYINITVLYTAREVALLLIESLDMHDASRKMRSTRVYSVYNSAYIFSADVSAVSEYILHHTRKERERWLLEF